MVEPADRWHPILPVAIVPRPSFVWWARVPDRHTSDGQRYATGELCENAEHPVYLAIRPQHATMPGCQGGEKQRTFYVCATCSPAPKDERGE